MVGDQNTWTALLAFHHERGDREAVAYALRPAAPVPGPRVDARIRRRPRGLQATARLQASLRRPDERGERTPGGHAEISHPPFEMVDPFRVPGQPAHAD